MASFKCSDDMVIDLEKKLEELGESSNNKLKDKMLNAGADVVVEAWKKSIKNHKHIDTSAMINSVKSSKKRTKSMREIYPQGKDEKGVRNAEKAFIANYGKTSQLGDRFVDEAEAEANVEAVFAMQDVFDEYLKSKGLM